MVTQEDTIFVSGMNTETTEDDIANHFGAIGIIKVYTHIVNHSRLYTIYFSKCHLLKKLNYFEKLG